MKFAVLRVIPFFQAAVLKDVVANALQTICSRAKPSCPNSWSRFSFHFFNISLYMWREHACQLFSAATASKISGYQFTTRSDPEVVQEGPTSSIRLPISFLANHFQDLRPPSFLGIADPPSRMDSISAFHPRLLSIRSRRIGALLAIASAAGITFAVFFVSLKKDFGIEVSTVKEQWWLFGTRQGCFLAKLKSMPAPS